MHCVVRIIVRIVVRCILSSICLWLQSISVLINLEKNIELLEEEATFC